LDEVPEDNINAGGQELTTEELVEDKQQVSLTDQQELPGTVRRLQWGNSAMHCDCRKAKPGYLC
jgi:hypothetical protein